MQRFIKTLAYGFIATAVTVVSVHPAQAQKGGHGGGGSRSGIGGGGMGNTFKAGPQFGQTGMGGTSKSGGGNTVNMNVAQHKTNLNLHNGIKNVQPNLAKTGSAPFAKPAGEMHPSSYQGKFNNFYCSSPYGSKYWCNNWKGCYPNWCWNSGCYPYWSNYCWPKNYCWYPGYSYYPSCYSSCYALSTPACYSQTVYVPTVVQSAPVVVPPVEEVTTTNTVSRTTVQPAVPGAVPPGDMSFLTGSALNQ